MSSVPELTELYKSFLTSLGCKIEDSMVSIENGEGLLQPLTIDDRRVVIPTREILRASAWGTQIPFHPLSESAHLGISPVLKHTAYRVCLRLNEVISYILMELMAIAIDKERHAQLSPTQTEMLSIVPDVDETTFEHLKNIISRVRADGEHRLINIYLKKAGNLGKKPYRRIATITFPVLDDLKDESHKKVFGHAMRVKDKKAILALFRWVFPDCEEDHAYSRGSNSEAAPFFDALVRGYVAVQQQVNSVSYKFRKHLTLYEDIHTDISWAEDMADLTKYLGHIPVLAGNDGDRSAEPTATVIHDADGVRKPRTDDAKAVVRQGRPAVADPVTPRFAEPVIAQQPHAATSSVPDDPVYRERDARRTQARPAVDEVQSWGQLMEERTRPPRRGQPRFADHARGRDDRDDRDDRGSRGRGRDDDRRGGRDARDDRYYSRGRDDRDDGRGRGREDSRSRFREDRI